MDFDFMEIIFFLVWGFFLFKAVFGGRRKRGPLPPLPEEPREPLPKENPFPHQEESGETVPSSTYDYEKLRKKILTSWGGDAEKKEPNTVPVKPAEKEEKPLHPLSVSAKIEKQIKPALKKVQVSPAIRREEKQMKALVHEQHHHSQAEIAAFSVSYEKENRGSKRKWTQEDAKQWLVYDAIFGPPRSKRPWGMERRSCR